jgi:type IV pilus assembly protein PilP
VVVLLGRQARPFRSFLSELSKKGGELATRCATPLGKFELEQLKLVAVVTGLENPVAMVQAPNGVGYSLRRRVHRKERRHRGAVRSGEVVIAEWAVRADGTRDRTQTVIRLPREAAMNLEE